jgi:uncharacterized protein YktB (UPF0637 family)
MGFVYSPLVGIQESEKFCEPTPELARLKYFKDQEFLIKDRIRKARENIKKNEKALKKLENDFSELIDIFPEEFI